jgi:hypothetical protein
MAKAKKKIKIVRVSTSLGETKNIGNYESLRVQNTIEAEVLEGQEVADVQEQLREAVKKLNERDFNQLLK